MNSRKIFWGFFLILMGIIYLLRQLGFISFHIDWSLIWSLWPAFLIILGLRLIFPKTNRTVNSLVVAMLVLLAGYIIYDGFVNRFMADDNSTISMQQPRREQTEPGNQQGDTNSAPADSTDADSNQNMTTSSIKQQFKIEQNSQIKAASLYLDGSAAKFSADVTHDNLFEADIHLHQGSYKMERSSNGQNEQIKLIASQTGSGNSSEDAEPNNVVLKLNPDPTWNLNMNINAGNVKYDFTGYKIATLKFNSGLASVSLKLGSLVPLAVIDINAGLAAFSIKIPDATGCKVFLEGTIVSTDLPGFIKKDEHTWVNKFYASAAKKVDISCTGSLSSISIKTY